MTSSATAGKELLSLFYLCVFYLHNYVQVCISFAYYGKYYYAKLGSILLLISCHIYMLAVSMPAIAIWSRHIFSSMAQHLLRPIAAKNALHGSSLTLFLKSIVTVSRIVYHLPPSSH